MKVKLIQITQNPTEIMWTAARTCYSAKSPAEMFEISETEDSLNKKWSLVQKVLNSGHQSIAEHSYFTFAIEGITRACSHQLVRHRAGIVFSQQSQRYIEIKESKADIMAILDRYEAQEMQALADKYFVTQNMVDAVMCIKSLLNYRTLIEDDFRKPEDARSVLPNATKTNITVSINLRELIHICNLRLCTRAQLEIRQLCQLMKKEVEKKYPNLARYMAPQCELKGFCEEHQCCGRKPHIDEIMRVYEQFKDKEN